MDTFKDWKKKVPKRLDIDTLVAQFNIQRAERSMVPATKTTPTNQANPFTCPFWCNAISNNPGFRLNHSGVPDSSDGSDGTLYPLTENYTLPVAQAMGRVA
jgi:hypothetical protein